MHMSWEKDKAKIEKDAAEMAGLLVGRKVTAVKYVPAYLGHIATVHLAFDDGSTLDITALTGGCSECDPEGLGNGVDVDYTKCRKGA